MIGACAVAYWVAAVAASVLSRAVPMAPPTCWLVDTIAEAAPASLWSTPRVASWNDAGMIDAIPAPITTRPGSTRQ